MSKQNWAKILQDYLVDGVDKVPDDWKTSAQIAKENGIGNTTASRGIKMARRAGVLEMQYFRIQLDKKIRKTPHYRIK